MEYHERVINGVIYPVLSVLILDEEDMAELDTHTDAAHLQLELSDLEYLDRFPKVETLILTGGIPTREGFEALYRHKELERLVLDYEETDSDEEGINLHRFPNLRYVLSRSNLNILGYTQDLLPGAEIRILNYYRDGKPLNAKYHDGYDLFPKRSFLFMRFETCDIVGARLAELLGPVADRFTDLHFGESFSGKLDRLAIIPTCLPSDLLPERRYISWKNRYADIRLRIDYHDFLYGSHEERLELCRENIRQAADHVRKKDATFEADRFLAAVEDVINELYG